jgi:UDP-GlcNAc3NAcA epimerase
MRIVSIVGARPEFIQAMPVSKAIRVDHEEILIHTGQHYDYCMSQQFFDELTLPTPDYNLEVGSGSQAQQTTDIMIKLEKVLLDVEPDFLILRGDTNSSLAAALVSSKLNIPFAHIEAGERSFNREMPEEINRIVADRIANFHFCVSQLAVNNLSSEGITGSVFWVGDVMLDALLDTLPIAQEKSNILDELGVEPYKYSIVTIHRPANTDNPKRLGNLFKAFNSMNETIILPLHPRTRKALSQLKIQFEDHVRICDPVGYCDMLVLEASARLIATDSGGVQREAYYLKVPCLTLRDETEWIATVESGWNVLTGTNEKLIKANWYDFIIPDEHPPIYGNGTAAHQIVEIINGFLEGGEK